MNMFFCVVVASLTVFSISARAQDTSAVCNSVNTDGGAFEGNEELTNACLAHYLRLLAESEAAATKKAEDDKNTSKENDVDDERENVLKDLEVIAKLKEQFKAPETDLPDLAAFQSTSQRYIADLAFAVGKAVGTKLEEKKIAVTKVLLVSDPVSSAKWLRTIDPGVVEADLASIAADFGKLLGVSCPAVHKDSVAAPTLDSSRKADPITTVAMAGAAIDVVVSLASNFQPSILSAASVPPPSGLGGATAAGVQSKYTASIWTVPPVIGQSNAVAKALQTATSKASDVEEHLAKMGAAPPKDHVINKTCVEPVKARATAIAARLKALVTSTDDVLGSPVDRAARAKAFSDAEFTHLLDIQHIVSGGAVSGYQRNRFSAIKLVTGSDIAVFYRLMSADGQVAATDYVSLGRGRSIPMGEFGTEYAK